MGILDVAGIRELDSAVLSANLSRASLMAGIDEAFVNGIRNASSPREQAWLDLHELNKVEKLANGTIPFETWLSNAEHLARPHAEAAIFRRYLVIVSQPPPVPPPPALVVDPPVAPSERTPPSLSGSRSTRYLQAWWLSGLSVLVMVVVTSVIMATRKSWHLARDVGDYIHVATTIGVFISVWWSTDGRSPQSSDDESKRCRDCIGQFTAYWKLLWITWIVFYAIHAIRHVVQRMIWGGDLPPWGWSAGTTWILDFMHSLQGTTLLILFWTMVRPTVGKHAFRWNKHHVPAWIACGLFAMMDGLLLLYCRYTRSDPSTVLAASLVPAVMSGLFAATCLGMFVGRLESIFLDVHPVELIALYAYVSTQPLFRLLALAEFDKDLRDLAYPLDLLLKSFALAMKLGLYSVVRRQIMGGRLSYYMWKMRALQRVTPGDWGAFERHVLGPAPSDEGPEERTAEGVGGG